MKKILFISLSLLMASKAYADPCAVALGNVFTSAQEVALCKNFDTSVINVAPVFVSTPVANVNFVNEGVSVVPTYAANVAAFVGNATPVPGQNFTIVNHSANAIRLVSAVGLNRPGLTVTPNQFVSVAANQQANCQTTSTTNINCQVPALPTPQ